MLLPYENSALKEVKLAISSIVFIVFVYCGLRKYIGTYVSVKECTVLRGKNTVLWRVSYYFGFKPVWQHWPYVHFSFRHCRWLMSAMCVGVFCLIIWYFSQQPTFRWFCDEKYNPHSKLDIKRKKSLDGFHGQQYCKSLLITTSTRFPCQLGVSSLRLWGLLDTSTVCFGSFTIYYN